MLRCMEVVAQTGPQTGVSIGRGTTYAIAVARVRSRGRVPFDRREFNASVPPLRPQRIFGGLRNGLHATRHLETSSTILANVLLLPLSAIGFERVLDGPPSDGLQ